MDAFSSRTPKSTPTTVRIGRLPALISVSSTILSFELGLIYTWQLKDQAAACAHWGQHRAEYPKGRYGTEVERAAASVGCTP